MACFGRAGALQTSCAAGVLASSPQHLIALPPLQCMWGVALSLAGMLSSGAVQVECKALEDKTVAVVNYGPDSDKQDLEELVHKLGATVGLLGCGLVSGPLSGCHEGFTVAHLSAASQQPSGLCSGSLWHCP